MATVPLTKPWIEEFRARVEPRLSRIQRAALGLAWEWLAFYWSVDGERPKKNHHKLVDDSLVYFERVETVSGADMDAALCNLAEFFQAREPWDDQ